MYIEMHPLEFEFQLPVCYSLDNEGMVILSGSYQPSVDYVLGQVGLLVLVQPTPRADLAWKFFTAYPDNLNDLGKAFDKVYDHGLRRITCIRAGDNGRVLVTVSGQLQEGAK